MEIIKKHLTNGQYLTSIYEKKSLFLHHTVGTTALSAWRWWNSTPERVGTPYIIDRDGSIMECFDPSMWAFHLGVRNDDNWHEKHSVNIELVSCGKLYLEGNEFRFYPLYPNKQRFSVIPDNEVFTFKNDWRGHKYFHEYTDIQLEVTQWLIKDLIMNKFPTIKVIEHIDDFYLYNEQVLTDHLGGIWSHSTVRKDKDDIYPSPRVLEAIEEVNKELYIFQNGAMAPDIVIKPTTTKKGFKSKPSSSISNP